MVLFIVTIACFLVVFSVSYLVFKQSMARTVSHQSRSPLIPLMIFGMLLITISPVIARSGPVNAKIMYLSYVGVIFLWLLSWPLRKRKAGSLLLNAGRTWHNKLMFWLGLWEGVIAVVITVVSLMTVANFSSVSETVAHLSKVSFWWTFTAFFLAIGLNRLELRENGICFFYIFVPWRQMRGYAWDRAQPNTLTVQLRPGWPLLSNFISIRVPKLYRDAIETVVQEHIPASILS